MNKRLHLGHLVAALLSGLLLALAFPKWDLTLLLFVALIPLFWAVTGRSLKAAFGLGFLAGMAHYVTLLYWIVYVTHVHGFLPLPLSIGILLLLAAYLSLYPALWALGVSWGAARGLSPIWWGPALWVTLEFGLTYIISGFPWELLGNGLVPHPILLQVADLTGVYGLSFLLVLINACLWRFLSFPRTRRSNRYPYAMVVCLILLAWLGYGYFRLGEIQKLEAQSPKLKVAVVQGNIKQGDKWKKEMVQATLDRYAELTRRIEGAQLIVWPETAAPFFFLRTGDLSAQVQTIAKESDASLLFGAPAWELAGDTESYFNRAYLLSPKGEVLGYYDKAHLVPFGEYVPLRRYPPFSWVGKMVPMVGDFAEGPVGATVSLPDGTALGPLVCYESIFPNLSRAQVANGAGLLVNITNDAWFGKTAAAYQHLAMAVMRCVENHVYLARAANTGISAFIDARGQILWQSEIYVPEAHELELPIMPGGSLYTRIGDVFAWACLILTGLTLILARGRRRD
ncbi:MAG: apolipoprotein N-acyltransferase [Deltaproteobacteria bacterium]|nr:apolipoprotein N-acyltransferase [Deltaproteobacteria bacterium]